MSHGEDLRAEVQDQSDGEALASHVMHDYHQASLSASDRTMLDFAIKLTQASYAMSEEDVMTLRKAGFDDVAIHDIVQVTALFNYFNRLVDGLGIDLEQGMGNPPSFSIL